MPRGQKLPIVTIVLEITDCRQCPKVKSTRTPGAGFAFDYTCTLLNRETSSYVEWESDVNPVPDDCPLLCDVVKS